MFWKKKQPEPMKDIWVFGGECEVMQVHNRFVVKSVGSEMYWGTVRGYGFPAGIETWVDNVRVTKDYDTIEGAIKVAEELENEYKRRHAEPVKVWRIKEEDND